MKLPKFVKAIAFTLILALSLQILPTAVIEVLAQEVSENSQSETTNEENSSEENSGTEESENSDEENQKLDLSTNEILFEAEEKRTESEKHFRMGDGSYIVAQYPSVIHYKDEEGDMQEIDNTLVAEAKSANDNEDFDGYVNKENAFKVKFAENSGDNLFSLIDDRYSISLGTYGISYGQAEVEISNESDKSISPLSMENNDLTSEIEKKNSEILKLENKSATADYNQIMNDVDLKYTLLTTGVKEDIIINNPKSVYQYSFELNLTNLTPIENEDGSISLMSIPEDGEEAEEKYTIPAPFMYDSNERYSEQVSYTLTPMGNGKYVLKITADKDWINSAETVFPVTIDPVIVKRYDSSTNIDDTFVGSARASTSFYTHGTMQVGYESSSDGICHSFIKFALPTLQNSDVVVSALMSYRQFPQVYSPSSSYGYSHTGTPSMYINAKRVTTSWSQSSTTWLTRPSRDSIILDSVEVSASTSNTWVEWDITKAVKGWYEGLYPNYGVALSSFESDPGTNNAVARFVTSTYPKMANASPALIIQYRNQKGLEGYWSFSSADAGNAGTAMVNDYNGNLVIVREDITSPSDLMPLSISHVYNGYMAGEFFTKSSGKAYTVEYGSDMRIGRGWKLNIQETIVPVPTNIGLVDNDELKYKYIYTDGDGTEHYFLLEDGKIVDEDGLGLTLTLDGASGYKLTDKDGNYKTFWKISGDDAVMTSSCDAYGNAITYHYAGGSNPGRIIRVSDPSGFYVNLTYSASGYLTQMTSSTGQTVICNYPDPNGRGYLESITDNYLSQTVTSHVTAAVYTYERVDLANDGYRDYLTIYETHSQERSLHLLMRLMQEVQQLTGLV